MIPNSLFLEEVELKDNGSRRITKRTAVILAMDKNLERKIYIQTHNFDGSAMNEPMLWEYQYWLKAQARWKKIKARADAERDARTVFDANVSNLTRIILKVARVNDSQAQMIATKMVREQSWGGAQQLGLKKVITNVSEI